MRHSPEIYYTTLSVAHTDYEAHVLVIVLTRAYHALPWALWFQFATSF